MQLGLGTVQFGQRYGITNRAGKVPAAEARRIIETALDAGVRVFDTAALYGDAETVLGNCLPQDTSLRIVTRLPHLPHDLPRIDLKTWVRDALDLSLARLRRDRIAGLLVHRPADLLGASGGQLFEAMSQLKAEGRVDALGVAAYDGSEVEAVLARYGVDMVQLPVSVVDQRLVSGGQLKRLKARGVEIHGRSFLLQGLLAAPAAPAPREYFVPWWPTISSFGDAARREGVTPLAAAVGFANCVPEIDCAVFGVTSVDEMQELVAAAATRLAPEWYGRFAINDENLVNPSNWPQ